jgi:fucose 4-O-acetylase-like acetyltransferase
MSPTPQTQQRVPLPQAREPVPPLVPAGDPGRRPAAKAARGQADKGRDAYFDNAKYLAIVLVAVGHSWPLVLSGSRTTETLYMWVYVFHMPAFIVISGYFSRSFDMQPAYAVFFSFMGDERVPVRMLSPYFLMWFLMALFVWRLLTPLFMAVRWPVALALLLAAGASAVPGISEQLSAQRVLQFLPFFVLGLRLRPEHFRLVQRWSVRWASIPVCGGSVAFLYWVVPHVQLDWVYRNHASQDMGQPWWVGVLMTFAMFAAALVLTACFLAWVPRRRMWFTTLGAGTIGGYLLHGFVLRYAEYAHWAEKFGLNTPVGRVVVTVCAVALVTVLCTPVVRKVLKPVTEPDLGWAFRKEAK